MKKAKAVPCNFSDVDVPESSPAKGGKGRGDKSINTKFKMTEKKILKWRTFFNQKKLFVNLCKYVFLKIF